MANECLFTQLRRQLTNADDALRLGETSIFVYPNMTFNVRWRNYNGTSDTFRVISGTCTSTSQSTGVDIVGGVNGCLIAVSNKYDIITLNGDANQNCYQVDANQFEFCNNAFTTVSRAKIIGDVRFLLYNPINYFQRVDLSEAEGVVDVGKTTNINVQSQNNPDVALIATGTFTTFPGGEATVFKQSPTPIPMQYNNVDYDGLAAKGPLWAGNIETDLRTSASYNIVRIDGTQATGALEKWIEKMIAVKSVGGYVNFLSTSNITLNGQILVNAKYTFHFNADTVTVTVRGSQDVIGTYTKATSTWSWV